MPKGKGTRTSAPVAPARDQKQAAAADDSFQSPPPQTPSTERKRWIKLSPREHVLKQIEAQKDLVQKLRTQLQNEEKTLQGMEKAKEFFPE